MKTVYELISWDGEPLGVFPTLKEAQQAEKAWVTQALLDEDFEEEFIKEFLWDIMVETGIYATIEERKVRK